jgi:multidrug efflux pump subunit AcrB
LPCFHALANIQRGTSSEIINHYDVQPVFDVYANVDRRDLGGLRKDIEKIIADTKPRLAKGMALHLRGQAQTMEESFVRLGIGIIFAVALVYLLMVVNFQSWIDPLIILMVLPGALAGVLWIPSLMGAIMSIGVGTSNGILLVVFASDERLAAKNERDAALSAGLRPICMTALAMRSRSERRGSAEPESAANLSGRSCGGQSRA